MSWFKRKKDWVSKEILTAADLDAEFDNVAEALNSLLQSGVVASSEALALSGSHQTVPGSAKTVTVARPSILLVWAAFELNGSGAGQLASGAIVVDGVEQPQTVTTEATLDAGHAALAVVTLSAGVHEILLHAWSLIGTVSCGKRTRYVYLVLPNPEP